MFITALKRLNIILFNYFIEGMQFLKNYFGSKLLPWFGLGRAGTGTMWVHVRSGLIHSSIPAFTTHHTRVCIMFFQAFELMSSSGIGLSVPQEKWSPHASLQYTTSEVWTPFPPFYSHVWYLWVNVCAKCDFTFFSLPSSNVQLPLHRQVWVATGYFGFPRETGKHRVSVTVLFRQWVISYFCFFVCRWTHFPFCFMCLFVS